MTLTRKRTSIKNLGHETLAKYGIRIEDTSNIFSNKRCVAIEEALSTPPVHTRLAARVLLTKRDRLEVKMKAFEERIISMHTVCHRSSACFICRSHPECSRIRWQVSLLRRMSRRLSDDHKESECERFDNCFADQCSILRHDRFPDCGFLET